MLHDTNIAIDWRYLALDIPPPAARARKVTEAKKRQKQAAEVHKILMTAANFLPQRSETPQQINPLHLERVLDFVCRGEKIQMVLPAFPAKSSNPEKTLGARPDMAEYVALHFLNRLCHKVAQVYSPGAEIIICSDGRVFSDLVLVKDDDVTAYGKEIQSMIETFEFENLKTFNLEDVFTQHSFDEMRDELVEEYGESIEQIREDVRRDEKERLLFCGIHRFILEDQKVIGENISKNQLSKRSKKVAYEVIQRSHAWSGLVEKVFPQAVRLSIHPQDRSSRKLGVRLVQSSDQWRTPWHSVALFDGHNYQLVKRKTAIELGAKEVCGKEGYSYYQVEDKS